ncbi:MAG: TetR family transcriptional regulator [Actinomycetota bacterium]|nr:TetR family transcriptional regulator [Actinomycetota bacterium]
MTEAHDPRERPVLPGSGAERLLDAAERLFAAKGFAGPSLREITLAAGHRNASAVAYHFVDRQGLLDAVWHRRTQITNARRLQMLSEIERTGRAGDLRALVEAHVLPLTEEMARHDRSCWARLNEARLAELPLDFVPAVATDLERFSGSVPLHVLLTLLGHVRDAVARDHPEAASLRVALFVRFVIAGLAAWERDVEAGRCTQEGLPAYADEIVGAAVALLEAP